MKAVAHSSGGVCRLFTVVVKQADVNKRKYGSLLPDMSTTKLLAAAEFTEALKY